MCRSPAGAASSSRDHFRGEPRSARTAWPGCPHWLPFGRLRFSRTLRCAGGRPWTAGTWGAASPGVHRPSLPGWVPDVPSPCHICGDLVVSDPHFLLLALYAQPVNSSIPSASVQPDLIHRSVSCSVATALRVPMASGQPPLLPPGCPVRHWACLPAGMRGGRGGAPGPLLTCTPPICHRLTGAWQDTGSYS